MLFEGNVEVFERLFLKQKLLSEGNPLHAAIRPILVVQGGAMRGVYAAGEVTALHDHGLTHVFDAEITASTGTPIIAYKLAEQVRLGRTIYWTECATREFLSLRRRKGGYVMDIDYLCEVFRGNTARNVRLDVDTLRRSRTQFYAAVTSTKTGVGSLIHMQEACDPINVIRASIAMPWLSHGDVKIGDESYLDGAVAFPFPATEAFRFNPTDILVLANCPKDEQAGGAEGFAASLLPGSLSAGVRKSFATIGERYTRELSVFRRQKECCWGILWTDNDVRSFDQNPKKLEAASLRAEEHLNTLLSEASVRFRSRIAA